MKKLAIIIPFVILFCAGTLYLYQKRAPDNLLPDIKTSTPRDITTHANFFCADGKNIQALFFKDRVELALSDKRNMLLSQAISASGARYANSDESFVFWNKGDTAFITEGATTTFKDCSTQEQAPVLQRAPEQQQEPELGSPAVTNCIRLGGTYETQAQADGTKYGMCRLKGNQLCEAWALVNYGKCSPAGR